MNPIITDIALHELNNELREIYNSNEFSIQQASSHSDNLNYRIYANNFAELSDSNNPEEYILSSLISHKKTSENLSKEKR